MIDDEEQTRAAAVAALAGRIAGRAEKVAAG